MTNTQYYNLTKAEGADTVNLLTQMYPNFDIIDNAMHTNAVATISTAVETKVGTTHQIVRTNSECSMFRFVATSNWTAGDSFTVDGVAVTAVAVDGQALQTGAFIINANVLCCVVGGLMTVYVGGGSAIAEDSNKLGGQLPAYYAKQSEVTTLNSNLSDFDWSKTSIPSGTNINAIIQMLMEKNFPKSLQLIDSINSLWTGDATYLASGNLQLSTGWASANKSALSKSFDITGYNTITFTGLITNVASSGCVAAIRIRKNGVDVKTLKQFDTNIGSRVAYSESFDVSDLTGDVQVRLTTYTNSSSVISEIVASSIVLQ